jgi:hypothetical protein
MRRNMRPAQTDDARESQLVSLAMDLAEKQMQEGTASSQVITHFLKQGSMRDRLERDRLAREVELLEAKVESMKSAHRVEELYEHAIQAMRSYAGMEVGIEDDYYDD